MLVLTPFVKIKTAAFVSIGGSSRYTNKQGSLKAIQSSTSFVFYAMEGAGVSDSNCIAELLTAAFFKDKIVPSALMSQEFPLH